MITKITYDRKKHFLIAFKLLAFVMYNINHGHMPCMQLQTQLYFEMDVGLTIEGYLIKQVTF